MALGAAALLPQLAEEVPPEAGHRDWTEVPGHRRPWTWRRPGGANRAWTCTATSGLSRIAQRMGSVRNQVNTVSLNPPHQDRVEGKSIVVIDDFPTRGRPSERALNLLLPAGAAGVIFPHFQVYTP